MIYQNNGHIVSVFGLISNGSTLFISTWFQELFGIVGYRPSANSGAKIEQNQGIL